QFKLSMKLAGAVLKAAVNSPLLSDEDRAQIRAGATEREIPVGANNLALSEDGTRLAAALPDRTIRLIDVGTGASRTLKGWSPRLAEAMTFSPHGTLLA